MANPEHLSLLKLSVHDWNKWRKANTNIRPDFVFAHLEEVCLSRADLSRADFREATISGFLEYADLRGANLLGANLMMVDLRGADLSGADLRETDLGMVDLREARLIGAKLNRATLNEANLRRADLSGADLTHAKLHLADLADANLVEANLNGAQLIEANLVKTNLNGVDLTGANLERSILVSTTCNEAIFTGCRIHGISAWDVQLEGAQQTNLIITPSGEPEITVDNLEVGQFIYLLLNNPRIREVIDTITSKVVLILGRFTPERKVVLDAIREKLRAKNYSPIVFDFEKPMTRDLTETVMTLAGMAKFVVADLTDPKSIPHELMSFVEKLPSVPVLPLLLASQKQEYAMFEHLQRYPWVMKTVFYQNQETLLRSLESTVILPAEQKAKELIASQRK